jgi:hypothetical protein
MRKASRTSRARSGSSTILAAPRFPVPGSLTFRYPIGALAGHSPCLAFWVMLLLTSAAKLAEFYSAMSAWMPSTSFPDAVSSMFSVTETSCTPALLSRARIATWSSLSSGEPVDLVDHHGPDIVLGDGGEHRLEIAM